MLESRCEAEQLAFRKAKRWRRAIAVKGVVARRLSLPKLLGR